MLKDPRTKTADRLKASKLLARGQGVFLRAFKRAGDSDGGAVDDVIVCLPDNGGGDGGADGA